MIFSRDIFELAEECDVPSPVYLHVFPHTRHKGRDNLSFYRDRFIVEGVSGMIDENKHQTQNNFAVARSILVLVPIDRSERYVFAGAYQVLSRSHPNNDGKYTIIENELSDNKINQLFGRIVFRWSSPCRVRCLKIKENGINFNLIELREKKYGESDVPFPGFYSFHLNREEFDARIGSVEDTTWKAALSSVSGVYVITDKSTGDSYVGSAYSAIGLPNQGIWQRWQGYLGGGHNGNILLREHIERRGAGNLIYSILHTMDIGSRKEDVIQMESFYKNAFGTRVHGLNIN